MNQLILLNKNIENKKKESFDNEKYDSKFKISTELYQRTINTNPEHMKNIKSLISGLSPMPDTVKAIITVPAYKEGKNIEVAVFEAAAIRLRPILMTSLSTIIGVLPLILGTGPGAASRLTVGITIFGGMIFSTFFTLYVIPTIYTIVGRNTKRIDAIEIDLNKQLKK